MATRVYLPSSGSAAVTPSTWNFGAQINPLTLAGVLTPISSTMTSKTEATGTTNPTARAMFRWVIGPLAAQTISGNAKGQMRGSENNAGANATLAIAIKIIQPGGTDRAVLLAQTAADSATSPFELLTSLTNRQFNTAAESTTLALTSQSATEGDYLVIEVGFRSATGTSRNITLSYGDDSGTDLPENTSTTTANNPWVEFSNTIKFLSESDGSAAGTTGGTFDGAAVFAGVGAADGTTGGTVTGACVCSGVGSAAGVGTATGDGEAVSNNYVEADGASAGTSTAEAIGAAVFAGVADSSGNGAASGVSAAIAAGVASAGGVAAVSGIASATAGTVGSSDGTGAASAISSATAQAEGSSTGAGVATGIGAATAESVASATGEAAVSATSAAIGATVAASAGTSTAAADGEDIGTGGGSDGAATGTSTVSGVGAAISAAVGSAAGTSTVTGESPAVAGPAPRSGGWITKPAKPRKRPQNNLRVAGEDWSDVAREYAYSTVSDLGTVSAAARWSIERNYQATANISVSASAKYYLPIRRFEAESVIQLRTSSKTGFYSRVVDDYEALALLTIG